MTPIPQTQRPPMGPVEAAERRRALAPMFEEIDGAKEEIRQAKIAQGLDPDQEIADPEPPSVGPGNMRAYLNRLQWENDQESPEVVDETGNTTLYLPSEWKDPENGPIHAQNQSLTPLESYEWVTEEEWTVLSWVVSFSTVSPWLNSQSRVWKLLKAKLAVMYDRDDPKAVILDERRLRSLPRNQHAVELVNLHLALQEVQRYLGYSQEKMAREHLVDRVMEVMQGQENWTQAVQELYEARTAAGV